MSDLQSRIGVLPVGWRVTRFGEVLAASRLPLIVNRDDTYREIGIRSHGKGIFHKDPVKGTELGDKRVFWVEAARLVFNIVFAWERAVAVTSPAEEGMIASFRFPMFRPSQPGTVDVEFLRRFFLSDRGAQLLAEASPGGAGRNRTLNQEFLADIPVTLPPLPEQQRIAAVLSAVDEVIEKTEAVIMRLQHLKKAMMQELLTRGLPGRHTRFKQTEIGEIPNDWTLLRVDQIAAVAYGLTVNSARRQSNERRPYLTVANLQEHGFRLDEVKEIGILDGDCDRYECRLGDVLIVEGNGNPTRLGRSAVWRDEIPGALHQNHLIRARPDTQRVDPDWLSTCLHSAAGRVQIEAAAKTSSGLHTINSTVVGALVVPLPPLAEQREAMSGLMAIDARRRNEEAFGSQASAVKSALMAALLTGELRVTADEDTA